jgi:drug/metabolite transporter (DMT)-like permease
MNAELGIGFAFGAMFLWGFGDFLIQKFARRIGDWESLFYISILGAVVILPFIYNELPQVLLNVRLLLMLLLASFTLLIAALLDFETLKKGKIAVAEPIFALEIPVSAMLAFFIIDEGVGLVQIILIAGLVMALVLVSLKRYSTGKRAWLEKGVVIAVLGSIFMGITNFMFGFGARATSALMINWFTSLFLAIVCLVYLASKSGLHRLRLDAHKQKGLLLGMCVLDNGAWIAFAYSMVFAPIAIAVSISQCYVIITVLLGIFVSREKLKPHQKIGIVLAIAFAIALAAVTG